MKHFETNESREWEVKLYHVVKVRLLRLGLGLSVPGPEQMGPKGPRDLSSQACRLGRTRMGRTSVLSRKLSLYLTFQPQLE